MVRLLRRGGGGCGKAKRTFLKVLELKTIKKVYMTTKLEGEGEVKALVVWSDHQ